MPRIVDRAKHLGSETFGSVRVRNFRLFFIGQGISQVGNWMTFVSQALLVLELSGNGFTVGLLTACQFGPMLLLAAWGGAVADRHDKRKMLLLLQFLAMIQSFVLAGLAFMDHPPVAGIFVVALVGGTIFAFDNPTRRAFVTEMVPEDLVHNAVSLNTAMMTSARVVGPAVAGLLITTVGYGWGFVADGLSYIAVLVCLALMRPAELRAAPPVARAKRQVRDALSYAWGKSDLAIPLVMTAVVGTLAFNFQVVFPLMVTRVFDRGPATFTVLFSVISIGSLLGALSTARRSDIEIADVSKAALWFGVTMLLFAVAPSLAWGFPLGLVVGFTSVGFLTASTAIVQVRAAPEMRARVLAFQAIVFIGSTPVGGPILGAVADRFGPRSAVAVGGVACLAAGVWGWSVVRRPWKAEGSPMEPDLDLPEPV